MLHCDHNNYTTCLLTLDKTVIKSMGLKDETLLLKTVWENLNIWKNKSSNNQSFPNQWVPSSFQLITEPFSEQNKMINSTMKMVRYKITDFYRDRIDYMYSDEGKEYNNKKNMDAAREILT